MDYSILLPAINTRVKISSFAWIVDDVYREYLNNLSFEEVLDVCNCNVYLSKWFDPICLILDNGVNYDTIYGLTSASFGLYLFTEDTFPEHVSDVYPDWKKDFEQASNNGGVEYEEFCRENFMEPKVKHEKKYRKLFDSEKLDVIQKLKRKCKK